MGIKHGNIKSKVGETCISNEGFKMTIVAYENSRNIEVQFEDGTIIFDKEYSSFTKGALKNPNFKKIFNVGYIGVGKYPVKQNGKTTLMFSVWHGMLRRCYDEKSLDSHPSYKDVTVCEEWKCFQTFAEWFEENYKEGFQLDKDILNSHCRMYSPETCCFVPQEINALFTDRQKTNKLLPTGVTKSKNRFRARINRNGKEAYLGLYTSPKEASKVFNKAKELYIKEVAEEWRGKIEENVYQAMINYKIKTT